MLSFDAQTSELLDDAYQGADVVRRRRANFDALDIQPGEHLLDIGCGTGLLALELGRAVGPPGRVVGIDPSQEMLDSAIARCAAKDNIELLIGSAEHIPVDAESMDRAVSLQVFEYLSDIPAALAAVAGVLKPSGRLVIGDTHWDSWIWFSDDPERMNRVMAAWDEHLADRCAPERLPAMLSQSGFRLETVRPVTFCDTVLRPDGLANMMLILIERYITQNRLIPEDEARAWAEEQRALAGAGRFFFSLTHFVVSAHRI